MLLERNDSTVVSLAAADPLADVFLFLALALMG